MANYRKFTRGALGHMLKHYERAKDENGEYVKFGNQDIDSSRTEQNYNLGPSHPRQTQLDFIHNRLEDVYCMNRKDINVMCSWVVTAPTDLKSDTRRFFEESYSFLEQKYGRENVISAYVHMDEKTPHMHFAFMPIVKDEKRNGYKVSAKECVCRKDLERFHSELQKHMDERGISCSIINEMTLSGNKAIKELKRGTARQELADLQNEIDNAESRLKALQGHILTQEQVKAFKIKKSILGGTRAVIEGTPEELQSLKATAERVRSDDEVVRQAYDVMKHSKKILNDAELQAVEILKQAKKECASIRMERARQLTEKDSQIRELKKFKEFAKTVQPDLEQRFAEHNRQRTRSKGRSR